MPQRAVALALFLGLSAACSSAVSASGKDAGSEAGAPDSTAPIDAGTGPDSTSPPPPPPPPPPATGNIGAVFAISDTVVGAARHQAGAFFVNRSAADTSITTRTVGPCVVEKIGDGTPAVEKDLSAGVLHLTGGKRPIDLAPGPKGTYTQVAGAEALWSGGETLTVTADGKDVPAFTVKVVTPAKVTLTAPALTSGSALAVTRSAPLAATWTGGGAGGEVVLYFDLAAGANAYSATCTFSASAGAGEIPAAAFADFPSGSGTYNFYSKASATATPADWYVRFTTSSAVVNPAGASAEGTATFR